MPEARAQLGVGMASKPLYQTLLGFDHGQRRIGVAVGQSVSRTANALSTLSARDGQPDWAQLAALIDRWQPDALIVGLPLQLDGSHSDSTRAAERFARRLQGRFQLPVHLHDERLSSHAAEHWLETSAGKISARPCDRADRAGVTDRVAAQIILQDWLDSQGD